MTGPLPLGKIPAGLLAELIGRLPPLPPEVLLGPAPGEDACAIAPEGAGALVLATDPVTLAGGGAGAGRLAVIVNANDVAVCGVRPRWFLAATLLPPGTGEAEVRALFEAVSGALAEVGAVLVGGHTEVTAAVRQPVVVGQMAGWAADGRIVRTGGARAGDAVVQIGPAPVEGGAVLATSGHPALAQLPGETVRAAAAGDRDPGVSVVEAALAAAELGATSLHDPTEGGLAGGLNELAGASRLALRVDSERLVWFEPALAVCRAVGADPLATLSSGCVLAAFGRERAAGAVAELVSRGYAAGEIGELAAGAGVTDASGRPVPLPARDEVARLAEETGSS